MVHEGGRCFLSAAIYLVEKIKNCPMAGRREEMMKKLALSCGTFVLAILSVFVVQYGITRVWNIFGVSWGPANLPLELVQQLAMLSTTFVAGLFAPIVAIVLCRRIPWGVIFSICAFGLAMDFYAALIPLADLPLWFRVAFVLSVPLQVYVGTRIGSALITWNRDGSVLSRQEG